MRTSQTKQNGSSYIDSEKIYHSFNRTNNKEPLFKCDHDHQLFLDTINNYLSPYLDFITHNLIYNHFHFMYKVKSIYDIDNYLESLKPKDIVKTQLKFINSDKSIDYVDALLMNQFRRASISYAEKHNFVHGRKGNLFYKNMSTVCVDRPYSQLVTMRYINCNTIKHKMDILPSEYEWSSYNDFFGKGKGIINKELALSFFENLADFKSFHEEYIELHAAYLLKQNEIQDLEAKVIPSHLRKIENGKNKKPL